jgi:hypothetical protein
VFDELPQPLRRHSRSNARSPAPFEGMDAKTCVEWFCKEMTRLSYRDRGLAMPPDPSVALEGARLQDVLFRKIEGTGSLFRRVVSRFKRFDANAEEPTCENAPSEISPKAKSPSTSQLPILWGNSLAP